VALQRSGCTARCRGRGRAAGLWRWARAKSGRSHRQGRPHRQFGDRPARPASRLSDSGRPRRCPRSPSTRRREDRREAAQAPRLDCGRECTTWAHFLHGVSNPTSNALAGLQGPGIVRRVGDVQGGKTNVLAEKQRPSEASPFHAKRHSLVQRAAMSLSREAGPKEFAESDSPGYRSGRKPPPTRSDAGQTPRIRITGPPLPRRERARCPFRDLPDPR
jgi:hypothetical protein